MFYVFDHGRIHEVPAQAGNVLKEDDRMAKRHVIEQDQVLVNLPHISHMRHHRHLVSPRQQADREELSNAGQPRAIRLRKVHGATYHEVAEHYAIGYMLTQGDAEGRDSAGEPDVSLDIVRMGGLFDPIGIDLAHSLAHAGGLLHGPLLIGVKHDPALGPGELAKQGSAAHVSPPVLGTNLELQSPEASV